VVACVLTHSDSAVPTWIVMPGFVPGIHGGRRDLRRRPVDGRVKPGHDGRVNLAFASEH